MARTTQPKEDKTGTSSVEAPMTQALVAWSGSKAPDNAPVNDNPELLNFVMVVA
jgi:hypothetical protein